MRTEHVDKSIRKGWKIIAPKLQAIDSERITAVPAPAGLIVMLKPSERRSIFDRINYHGSNLDREAINFSTDDRKVSRADILAVLRLEIQAQLRQAVQDGYAQAKRESLLPPSGPAMAMRRAA